MAVFARFLLSVVWASLWVTLVLGAGIGVAPTTDYPKCPKNANNADLPTGTRCAEPDNVSNLGDGLALCRCDDGFTCHAMASDNQANPPPHRCLLDEIIAALGKSARDFHQGPIQENNYPADVTTTNPPTG